MCYRLDFRRFVEFSLRSSPMKGEERSPGHYQNWECDFLYSDWLTQNQNIA